MPNWVWSLVSLPASSLEDTIARAGSIMSSTSPSCLIGTSVPLSQGFNGKALRNVRASVLVWRGGAPGNWSDVPLLAASLGVGCEMPDWLLAAGDGEKGG